MGGDERKPGCLQHPWLKEMLGEGDLGKVGGASPEEGEGDCGMVSYL